MRHRVAHRKLGRVTEHRIALLRNQASALFQYERVQTTVARGKELRPFAEKLISVAKRSLNAPEGSMLGVNARRMVSRDIANREIVTKLFETIAPRFAERNGGYTRLLRIGHRRGDSAEVAEVELVGSEFDPKAVTADKGDGSTPDQPKKKTLGERIRGAMGAARKADQDQSNVKGGKVDKRGAGKKITSPRKAGGS
jgi:large subunit ribosomal protein L17